MKKLKLILTMTLLIVCNGFSSLIVDGRILVFMLWCVFLDENFSPLMNLTFFYLSLFRSALKLKLEQQKFFLAFYSAEKDINTFYMYLIFFCSFSLFAREIYVAASRAFELSKNFLFFFASRKTNLFYSFQYEKCFTSAKCFCVFKKRS